MDPIQIEFHHSALFQWSKGFHFSPKVNEADNGYNDQIWNFCMVYHTAYLQNEPGDPVFFGCISGIRFPESNSYKSLNKFWMLEDFSANVLKNVVVTSGF